MSLEEQWIKLFHRIDKSKLTNIFRIIGCSQHLSNAVVERFINYELLIGVMHLLN